MEQGSSAQSWHGSHLWEREEWSERANCLGVDPELFFPDRGESAQPAKEVCAGCVVSEDCLDYSLRFNIKHGVWGGLAERDRRPLRASRQTRPKLIRRSAS